MAAVDPSSPDSDGSSDGDGGIALKDAGVSMGSTDAGSPDAGAFGDAGPADAGNFVPLFVAQGMMGRTTISCDDGETWVANHSWDLDADPLVCGSTQMVTCWQGSETFDTTGQCQTFSPPCIDSPDVAKGVAFGNGTFVATWGWGPTGVVRQSSNGIDWTTTHAGDPFGGVVFGAGRFVLSSRSPFWSTDGANWTAGQTANFQQPDGGGILWSVRRFAYADYQGGRFIAVSDGVLLISSDGGETWHSPTVPPQFGGAVSDYGDVLYGNGLIVIIDSAGTVNVSSDGGDTWTTYQTGQTQILSRGIWTGTEFWIWANGYRLSSPDGKTWTQTPLTGESWIEGVVARSPLTGTLVAVQNEWNGYSQQVLLRSADGVNWDLLPASAFVASHPLWAITFGYAPPSAACP
jgi:hypothetical protein